MVEQYLDAVNTVLRNGNHKPNRTGVDTISSFGHFYRIDLSKGFPLLTTKKMDGYRWNSLIHEIIWYFSGEEHIRNLREHTKIWDAWADDNGRLETAYGRFWRRYPIPGEADQLDGEAWPENGDRWVNKEKDGRLTFDQLQYVIDTLNDDNPDKSAHSRRLVINAWHPANAAVSTLPPCHYSFVFNVQGDKLNVHLTQRSCDLALGVPFNIACYSILANIVAQQTGFDLGYFGHTLVDAHVYCGKGDRGTFYQNNLAELQERLDAVEERDEFVDVKGWVQDTAPEQEKPYDHVPGLLEQLSRDPKSRPSLFLSDKDIDELAYDDIQLKDYDSHPGLTFAVAE